MIITTGAFIALAWMIGLGARNTPLQREAQARLDAAEATAKQDKTRFKELERVERLRAEVAELHLSFLKTGFPIPPRRMPVYTDSAFEKWRAAR